MRLLNVLSDDGPRLVSETASGLLDLSAYLLTQGLEVSSTDVLLQGGGLSLLGDLPGDLAGLHPADPGWAVLPVVMRPEKIICVGLNYLAHLEAAGHEKPDYPCLFGKFSSSLAAHGQEIRPPRVAKNVDYEGELAVIIGREGREIPRERALDYVFGYSVANDISSRTLQYRTPQWLSGKGADTFCPVGPVLVTKDEVKGPQDLWIRTYRNGLVVQDGHTSQMLFPVATIVEEVSRIMTLRPGDLILTGTPSGTQREAKDPHWLQEGDLLEVEIEGIGRLQNTFGPAL